MWQSAVDRQAGPHGTETWLHRTDQVVHDVPGGLDATGADHLEVIDATEEVRVLAARYVEADVPTEKSCKDAEHIAAETVAGLSVAASWSLRHMVNLWRIQCYNPALFTSGLEAR